MAGHSLGGGVATLLALAAQDYLDGEMGADAAPVVAAALYAPPNAGSPQFVEQFNARVNSRRFAFEYDIVPQASRREGNTNRAGLQGGAAPAQTAG